MKDVLYLGANLSLHSNARRVNTYNRLHTLKAQSSGIRRPHHSWRYRWPDDFRDEVLARLLELNRQYAEEERLNGAAAEKKGKKTSTAKNAKSAEKKKEEAQGDLF